jgi:hypothetical protein
LKKTEEFNQKLKSIKDKFNNLNSLFISKADEDSTKYKKLLIDNDTNLDENGQPAPVSNTIIPAGFNLELPSRRPKQPEVKPPPKPIKDPTDKKKK